MDDVDASSKHDTTGFGHTSSVISSVTVVRPPLQPVSTTSLCSVLFLRLLCTHRRQDGTHATCTAPRRRRIAGVRKKWYWRHGTCLSSPTCHRSGGPKLSCRFRCRLEPRFSCGQTHGRGRRLSQSGAVRRQQTVHGIGMAPLGEAALDRSRRRGVPCYSAFLHGVKRRPGECDGPRRDVWGLSWPMYFCERICRRPQSVIERGGRREKKKKALAHMGALYLWYGVRNIASRQRSEPAANRSRPMSGSGVENDRVTNEPVVLALQHVAVRGRGPTYLLSRRRSPGSLRYWLDLGPSRILAK